LPCSRSSGSPRSFFRSHLDPHIENHRLHFVVFGIVGGTAFLVGCAAGEAADRRGDARVLLLALAFVATGGFLGVHALGTPGILFVEERGGFQVAIPVGLLVAAVFATASAFIDLRPDVAPSLIRRRTALTAAVLAAMGAWFAWAAVGLPQLGGPGDEAATDGFVMAIAVLGTAMYFVSAVRYWSIYRHRWNLLPAAVITCNASSRGSPDATPNGRRCASESTAARRCSARSAATATSPTRSSATR
jgi:hypothetical protein